MREETLGAWLKRMALATLIGFIFLAALVYLGDWAVWRIRVARGCGMGTVTISRFVVAPLKANKEAYYYDGTGVVDCSRSMFPQAGSGACWWVERHKVVFDR